MTGVVLVRLVRGALGLAYWHTLFSVLQLLCSTVPRYPPLPLELPPWNHGLLPLVLVLLVLVLVLVRVRCLMLSLENVWVVQSCCPGC